jgi:hypothetical protein
MFKEEFALAIPIDVLLIKSCVYLLQVVMWSYIPSCNHTNGKMDLSTHD